VAALKDSHIPFGGFKAVFGGAFSVNFWALVPMLVLITKEVKSRISY